MQWLKTLGPLTLLTLLLIFYNEFFIFYHAFSKCEWPCKHGVCSDKSLKAFMISDTHLLGTRKGHWLDKLKREWQMRQSFHIATWLQNPDIVFFLGDLMDEGQWADRSLFMSYADRFRQLFTGNTKIITLAGNHDLGFHYAINPETVELFRKEFRRGLIDQIWIKEHRFILINSMALHGDGCRLCHDAEVELEKIRMRNRTDKPIVLQHFPLFRKSDEECEKVDEEHEIDLKEMYREQWDTLSKESSMKLINSLNPRAIFGGHTHKLCKKSWKGGDGSDFYEYTINSFSWRNGDVPALFLVTIEKDEVMVNICRLPSESLQITVYIIGGAIIFIFAIVMTFRKFVICRSKRRYSHILLTHRNSEKSE